MATITKPIITDETGQAIVDALEQNILSITDATGQDIVNAINTLSASMLHTSDVVDDLTSTSAVSPLSANQGKELKNLLINLWNTIFPIGSVYITTTNTNPSTFLGGTWIQTPTHTVIETNVTDRNWYRVYSDGWVEQGGNYGGANANWVLTNINFPKPFRNTNYSVQTICGHTANTDSPCINVKTPTYFSGTVYNATGNANWYACGYGETQAQTRWYWKRTA